MHASCIKYIIVHVDVHILCSCGYFIMLFMFKLQLANQLASDFKIAYFSDGSYAESWVVEYKMNRSIPPINIIQQYSTSYL